MRVRTKFEQCKKCHLCESENKNSKNVAMPLKTSVKDIKGEENGTDSPLRRSSRLAAVTSTPKEGKITTRRNSASDTPTQPARITRRLSLSQDTKQDDITETQSGKSPTTLLTEISLKSTPAKLQRRRGSKSTDDEGTQTLTESVPLRRSTRRSSITEKVTPLERINESQPQLPQKRVTRRRSSASESNENQAETGKPSNNMETITENLEEHDDPEVAEIPEKTRETDTLNKIEISKIESDGEVPRAFSKSPVVIMERMKTISVKQLLTSDEGKRIEKECKTSQNDDVAEPKIVNKKEIIGDQKRRSCDENESREIAQSNEVEECNQKEGKVITEDPSKLDEQSKNNEKGDELITKDDCSKLKLFEPPAIDEVEKMKQVKMIGDPSEQSKNFRKKDEEKKDTERIGRDDESEVNKDPKNSENLGTEDQNDESNGKTQNDEVEIEKKTEEHNEEGDESCEKSDALKLTNEIAESSPSKEPSPAELCSENIVEVAEEVPNLDLFIAEDSEDKESEQNTSTISNKENLVKVSSPLSKMPLKRFEMDEVADNPTMKNVIDILTSYEESFNEPMDIDITMEVDRIDNTVTSPVVKKQTSEEVVAKTPSKAYEVENTPVPEKPSNLLEEEENKDLYSQKSSSPAFSMNFDQVMSEDEEILIEKRNPNNATKSDENVAAKPQDNRQDKNSAPEKTSQLTQSDTSKSRTENVEGENLNMSPIQGTPDKSPNRSNLELELKETTGNVKNVNEFNNKDVEKQISEAASQINVQVLIDSHDDNSEEDVDNSQNNTPKKQQNTSNALFENSTIDVDVLSDERSESKTPNKSKEIFQKIINECILIDSDNDEVIEIDNCKSPKKSDKSLNLEESVQTVGDVKDMKKPKKDKNSSQSSLNEENIEIDTTSKNSPQASIDEDKHTTNPTLNKKITSLKSKDIEEETRKSEKNELSKSDSHDSIDSIIDSSELADIDQFLGEVNKVSNIAEENQFNTKVDHVKEISTPEKETSAKKHKIKSHSKVNESCSEPVEHDISVKTDPNTKVAIEKNTDENSESKEKGEHKDGDLNKRNSQNMYSETNDYDEAINDFIDDMAEEIDEEEEESDDSNQIECDGESLHSSDTDEREDVNDSYENDSFIDDEDHELLSGEEDFLEEKSIRTKPDKKSSTSSLINKQKITPNVKKYTRIVTLDISDSDESININLDDAEQNDDTSDQRKNPQETEVINVQDDIDVQEDFITIDEDSGDEVNDFITIPEDTTKSRDQPEAKTNTIQIEQVDIDYENAQPSTSNIKLDNSVTDDSHGHSSSRQSIKRSSMNVQENISLKDVEDGELTERITKVVEWFCTGIKSKGEVTGNISLNVSLDYEDSKNDSPQQIITGQSASMKRKSCETADSFQARVTPSKRNKTGDFVESTPPTSAKKRKKSSTNVEVSKNDFQSPTEISENLQSEFLPKRKKSGTLEYNKFQTSATSNKSNSKKETDRNMYALDVSGTEERDNIEEIKRENTNESAESGGSTLEVVINQFSEDDPERIVKRKRRKMTHNKFEETPYEHDNSTLKSITEFTKLKFDQIGDWERTENITASTSETPLTNRRKNRRKRRRKVINPSLNMGSDHSWKTEDLGAGVCKATVSMEESNSTGETRRRLKKTGKKNQDAGPSNIPSFHPKDYKNQLMYAMGRVDRMDTNILLRKKKLDPGM